MATSSSRDDRRRSRSRSPRGRSEHRRSRSRSHSRSAGRHERRGRRSQSREGSADRQKAANRKEVEHRSRMWTVVDSDSEADDKRRNRSSHRRKRRSRSASSSSSSASRSSSSSDSSESESDASSEDSRRRHRKHKSKKRKRDSSDRKKSRKKKHKKEHKKKKSKKSSKSSHAVNQNEYGKYGILRESDFHAKSVSFQAWLRDIKKIADFNGPKWEAMELFKEYMEDYNTCTLPHEKYYDIEKYELQHYQKQQRRAHKKMAATSESLGALADEERVRRERREAREKQEQEEFRLVLQTMDKDKIDAMRHQENLRAEMQMHYKSGNVAEARRLEQLLNKADEEDKRRY